MNNTKKKTEDHSKEELLKLRKETNYECDTVLDKMIQYMTRFDDAISIINQLLLIIIIINN